MGVRSEVKNIGSIRGVASAIKFEIARQISELNMGGKIINETRSWDAQNKITVAMRDKETVQVNMCIHVNVSIQRITSNMPVG